MAFWEDWETWEKMVFILACSMAGVIIAGCSVAWIKRRRLQLYNQAFTDEAKRVRNIVDSGATVSEVPFGARALESGVQIDGIYTPGRYTPRQGTLRQNTGGSPVLSTPPTPLTPTVTRASHYEDKSSFSSRK